MNKSLTIVRVLTQRTNDETHHRNLMEKLVNPAAAKGKHWTGKATKVSHNHKGDQQHEFTYRVVFTKDGGKVEKGEDEWRAIYAHVLNVGGPNAYWNAYPWKITGGDIPAGVVAGEPVTLVQESSEDEQKKDILGVSTVTNPKVITMEQMRDTFPHELLGKDSDEAIANHSAFSRIFGRNAQIRSILSTVKSFLFTDGKRSSHICLDGPPGCGKTQILGGLIKVWGEGCALKLDATATTKAGVEKLYFDDLPEIPPFCVMEEIEKADTSGLTVWLGALDDRKEIRKVNFRTQKVRKVNFLALCTSNNRPKFNGLLEGALGSRFKMKFDCPRPTPDILKLILARDIREHGGSEAWIEPCLTLAKSIGTDDPRLVLAFLDGGDRLLTEEYQKDILAIHANRKPNGPVLVQDAAA